MTLPKEIVKAAVMGVWCFCTLFSGDCLYDTSGFSFCKVQNPTFLTFGESHNFQECNFMFWSVFVGLCAKREVSPNAVAKALGLSSGSVTLWKNGAVPRSTTIRKIADYFGVSPESFLAEADDLAIKKAPGINAEGFVPTMRDWEEQAESWTDDQILQAMQKLVEIQQRRRSDGR
jgi:transcriptional regulator with XRE-family HTH domain